MIHSLGAVLLRLQDYLLIPVHSFKIAGKITCI